MILLLACAPEVSPPAVVTPVVTAPAPDPAPVGPVVPDPAPPQPPPGWPSELPARLVRLSAEGNAWVVITPCTGDAPTLEVDGGTVWLLGETGVTDQGEYTGLLFNKAGYVLRYQGAAGPRELKLRWGDETRTWLYVGDDRYAVPSAVGSRFLVRKKECGP